MKISRQRLTTGVTTLHVYADTAQEGDELSKIQKLFSLEGIACELLHEGRGILLKFPPREKIPGFDIYYNPDDFNVGEKKEGDKIIRTFTFKNQKGEEEGNKIKAALWSTNNYGETSGAFQIYTRMEGDTEVPYNS